jgi:hypothetical protein
MSTKAGVGFSSNIDSKDAGIEAGKKALKDIINPNLIIVFSSISKDQKEVLSGIREINSQALLVGCSDAGQITTDGPSKGGVAVMAIASDSMNFIPGFGGNIADGAREAGQKLAKDIIGKTKDEIKAFMMFSDVLKGNGADIVRGIQDIAGVDALIVGGAAGDDFQFKETFVYLNDQVIPSALVGVGITGEFSAGIGVRHGWVPIGLPKTVTKSHGAVLEELDGKPAVNIYEEHFGKQAEELKSEPLAIMAITYPLGMSVEGSDELLIRDPITVDDKGAITCAAEIPEGAKIRIMLGSREDAIKAARSAAEKASEQLNGKEAKAIIIFNCIARSKLFGRHGADEIKEIQSILGEKAPLIGFYTYGEQAPLGGDMQRKFSCFHNETCVIFAIGD